MRNIPYIPLEIVQKQYAIDGSIKYMFKTADEEYIESMIIPQKNEIKFCISCQIGCVNKCTHCATGKIDYIRDLNSREIISQVISMVLDNQVSEKKLHVLFMGMGEPFLNFRNVINSLDLFREMNIPEEEITISTVGIIPKIYEYSNLNRDSKLAISLHAVSNEMRNRIIPLNKIYPLNELIDAAHYYVNKTNKKIIVEYVIIHAINDSLKNAEKLVEMIRGLYCEIHIIPFNENVNSYFKTPSEGNISSFHNFFLNNKVESRIKKSFGIDIQGGCGQLCCENKKERTGDDCKENSK